MSQESHQLDYMQHGVFVKNKGNESTGADQQHRLHNSRQVLVNSYKGAGETYDKQWNCYQRENSSDSYHSNASQHAITGHELRENVLLHESDSQPVAGSNQKSPGQVLCQQASQGSSSQEQGFFGQFKSSGNVSNGAIGFEKGHSHDIPKNPKEDVPPRGNVGANLSTSFDRSVSFYGPNVTVQTSQNMLKLLHKVDHDREHSTMTHLGSSDSNQLLEVPGAETPDASAGKKYDHSSASQHFGLKLAPPSQQSLSPNNLFSSRSSPQTGNSIAASPSGPPYLRNQLQRQQLPAASVASQSLQATLPGVASRLPNFNHPTSQDTSHPIARNPFGRQFPILEAAPVTQPSVMSGMSEQVGFSIRATL
ncbi:hypothetical protein F0562_004346 [Nyssa sinensis]|uniref:Uncharacterized protein n=1 Tax=Nyssa sinensis TaxID=561372 RepID=A0A5J5C1Z6_9ASTE|nr:hypothetical protein F0562_004346 [Nyssa sinensis]